MQVFIVVLMAATLGVTFGMQLQKSAWQEKTMGDLCEERYYWACHLHPDCSMYALVCFPNPTP